MLVGSYVDSQGNLYELEGYDLGSWMPFYLTPSGWSALKHADEGVLLPDEGDGEEVIPARWGSLYFQVNVGDVKVDDIKSEGHPHRLNGMLFSRISSIIRGMKNNCYAKREEDYNNLSFSGETIGSKPITVYKYFGSTIRLRNGYIYEVDYKGPDGETLYLKDRVLPPKAIEASTTKRRKFPLVLREFSRVDDLPTYSSMSELYFEEDDDSDFYSLSEIVARNPEKSYEWLFSKNYRIVNRLDDWKRVARHIYNHQGVLGFDTETTGLKITFKSEVGQGDQLVGLVYSIRGAKKTGDELLDADAWYVPFRHLLFDNICPEPEIATHIEMYHKPLLESKLIACHHGSFDAKVMFIYGVHINLVHDTWVLMKLTFNAVDSTFKTSLKAITPRFLGRDSISLSDFSRSGKWGIVDDEDDEYGNQDFRSLNFESTRYYACPDTDLLHDLLEMADKSNWWDEYGVSRVYDLEVQTALTIAYQEYFGHRLSVDEIDKFRADLEKDVEKYKSLIYECVGYSFNIGSPAQLSKALYSDLNIPILNYTASGKPSTDKDTLKSLKSRVGADGKPLYPVIDYLLKYRDVAKLITNFTSKIGELATNDGYMFSGVTQFLETGRMSVSKPNYQSYNDTVKKYISPRPGFYMVDSDYSSVEIRIMMSMAGETKMLEFLKDPEADYHTQKASQMFNVPYEQVTKKDRGYAKGANFGIVYGMGDMSLGNNITGKVGDEAVREGARLRKLYFKGMDITQKFIDSNVNSAVRNRYAETYFKRRRYFSKVMKIGSVKRQGGNHPIQGTAADLFKQAMVNLYAEIKRRGWWGKLLLTCFVHDEVVLEVHNSINPGVAMKVIRDCLMLDLEGWCPLYIGFGYGRHWYNAKKTEVPVALQNQLIEEYGDTGFPFWNGSVDELYAWEIQQIYDYKIKRIIEHTTDPANEGAIVAPAISAFVTEVLGYIKDLKGFFGQVAEFKELIDKINSDGGESYRDELVSWYYKFLGGSVNIDWLLTQHLPVVKDVALSQGDVDYLAGLLSPIVELSYKDFIPSLVDSDVSMASTLRGNFESVSKAFGFEMVGVLTPDEVETVKTETSTDDVLDIHKPEYQELDFQELLKSNIASFGRYCDYNESVLYLPLYSSSAIISYFGSSGMVHKKSDESVFNSAKDSWENAKGMWKLVFTDGEGVHPAEFFADRDLVNRIMQFALVLNAKQGA